MSADRIVSVGLLSERDLHVLGKGFTRHFPIADDGQFADLLAQLDHVEAVPDRHGIMLVPHKQS